MLPIKLKTKIAEFERRLFLLETLSAAAGGAAGALGSILFLFASDRLWDTPWGLRVLITLFGCLVFAYAGFWWARHWILKKRNSRSLAVLVQDGVPGIGDRLLGAVELSEGVNLPASVSPALCRAAVEQVASAMDGFDFSKALKRTLLKLFLWSLLACFAVTVALALFAPAAFFNSLARWFKPASDLPRYTFVSIDEIPDRIVVPHGEDFVFSVKLSAESAWTPGAAVCSVGGKVQLKADVVNGFAEFSVPRQVDECRMRLKVGDLRRSLTVVPVFRPELASMSAVIKLPGYLGHEDIVKSVEAGVCSVVDGSTLQVRGRAVRELVSAKLSTVEGAYSVKTSADSFETEFLPLTVVSNSFLSWIDCFGLEPRSAYSLKIRVLQDEPPRVECPDLPPAVAILEDEVLRIEVKAEDDFGISDLRLNWRHDKDERLPPESKLIAEGGFKLKEISGACVFSPIAEGIAEDSSIIIYGSTVDFMPGREPSVSMFHRIYVLSRTAHAKLIEDLIEGIQNSIDELALDEESLKQNNEDLLSKDGKSNDGAEESERIEANSSEERRNAERLEEIGREMKDLLGEMLRNSKIDPSLVQDWAEMAGTIESLQDNEMAGAVASMSRAGEPNGDRQANLKEAVEQESGVVEKLKELANKMGGAMEDMAARNFISRLKQLSSIQGAVAEDVKAGLPVTIGIPPEDLTVQMKDQIAGQMQKEGAILREFHYLYDDLGGFYKRTRSEQINILKSEMEAKATAEALEGLKDKIELNMGATVIDESVTWSRQFQQWAEMLASGSEGGGGGGGDGGGGGEEGDLETLIELLRIRQGEEIIREQTRILEERREGNRNYGTAARKLSGKQAELGAAAAALQRKAANKKIKELLTTVDGEMLNAAVYLKRPQTDQDTLAIQTVIIEIISEAVEESGGSGQSQSTAMVMQAGQKAGGAGGYSSASGSTDRGNSSHDGPNSGRADARAAEPVGGVVEAWPLEFREAIEAYNQAMEERK